MPWPDFTPPPPQPCGCTWDGRCYSHQRKMERIHAVWYGSNDNALLRLIWSRSDGYGEPGLIPEQGYDWSGIRDSSGEAIDAMYAACEGVPR